MLDLAEKAINLALDLGAEYADVRVERVGSTNIRMVKDEFEYVLTGVDRGLGIRTLYRGAWGFASTSTLEKEDPKTAAKNAVKAAKAASRKIREKAQLSSVRTCEDKEITSVKTPLQETEIKEKMRLVARISETARNYSPKIVSVTAVYGGASGERIIVTSDGTRITTKPSRASAGVLTVAKKAEKITSCVERVGSPGGFEIFEKFNVEDMASKTAKRAVNLLEAKPAPSGRFTVIVDPKLAGVFAHEAVGHACEGDSVASARSVLRGKIGQKIASENVTIYDDSTLPNGWGSRKYDMEGVLTRKRLLIDHGTLKTFITNRESAAKLDINPNGGARTQSYAFRPIVRMSNTYIAPGDYTLEEMLEDVSSGIYVKATRGGQVDPAKGTFQFSAEEAALIEQGKITKPLLDVSLSGVILETMKNINAVAKDIEMYIGSCGKEDQFVATAEGSPHIRIQNAVVGGRA